MDDFFEALRQRGLCRTKQEFAERWLGRSGNYMSDRKVKGPISTSALNTLWHRLLRCGQGDLAAMAYGELERRALREAA